MSTYSYQSFQLSLDKVSVSISRNGNELDPKTALERVTCLKNSALAMATGYCLFLNITGIAEDLKTEGADNELVNQILAGENINQWVATTFQESGLKGGQTSGFYQIDNTPADIAQNAKNVKSIGPYYQFLLNLSGGAVASAVDAPINKDNAKGFIWQSAEKGYYEAISYMNNKAAYGNVPYADFSFAKWAVDYAKNQRPTHDPLPENEHQGVDIPPALGFEQAMSLMYNRGQFPFPNPTIAPGKYLVPLFKKGESIAQEIPYDQQDFGKQYIWQLPWLCSLLNNGTKRYDEEITCKDITKFLPLLNGFYNGEDESTQSAAIIAAIEVAKSLTWGDAYNAPTTFTNLNKVVWAMMDASKIEVK